MGHASWQAIVQALEKRALLVTFNGEVTRLAEGASERELHEATTSALLQKRHSVLCVKLAQLSMLQQLVRTSVCVVHQPISPFPTLFPLKHRLTCRGFCLVAGTLGSLHDLRHVHSLNPFQVLKTMSLLPEPCGPVLLLQAMPVALDMPTLKAQLFGLRDHRCLAVPASHRYSLPGKLTRAAAKDDSYVFVDVGMREVSSHPRSAL